MALRPRPARHTVYTTSSAVPETTSKDMTGHSATILIPPVGCHHRQVQHWRLPSQPLRSVNVCFVAKAGKLSGKVSLELESSATKLRKAALLSLGPKGAPGEHQMSSLSMISMYSNGQRGEGKSQIPTTSRCKANRKAH